MEAVIKKHNLTTGLPLNEVMAIFFKANTLDSTTVLFWKFFQCWVTRECKLKADLTDEEVALFFDQLLDLVAAADVAHQANRASAELQKGEGHE